MQTFFRNAEDILKLAREIIAWNKFGRESFSQFVTWFFLSLSQCGKQVSQRRGPKRSKLFNWSWTLRMKGDGYDRRVGHGERFGG